jgi:hypothetical protein
MLAQVQGRGGGNGSRTRERSQTELLYGASRLWHRRRALPLLHAIQKGPQIVDPGEWRIGCTS